MRPIRCHSRTRTPLDQAAAHVRVVGDVDVEHERTLRPRIAAIVDAGQHFVAHVEVGIAGCR